MYTAMLVDDEKRVRSGLRRHFPWNDYGVEITAEAANGAEAWSLIEQRPTDIVITDVRMPQMSGIALAERLQTHFPDTKVVFVSGYDDLDYLKSALKLEAIDYILKSVDLDQLGETIRRVTRMLDRERIRKAQMADMEKRLSASVPLLQEKLLMRLIRDEAEDEEEIGESVRYLGLPLFPDAPHTVMVLLIENYYACYAHKTEHERQLLSMTIRELIEDLLEQDQRMTQQSDEGFSFAARSRSAGTAALRQAESDAGAGEKTNRAIAGISGFDPGIRARGAVLESARGEFCVILSRLDASECREALCALSEQMVEKLRDRLGIETRVGIGRSVPGYTNLREGYLSAERAVNVGVADQQYAFVRLDDDRSEDAHQGLERLEKRALTALMAGRADFIDGLIQDIGASGDMETRRGALFFLLTTLLRFTHQNCIYGERAFGRLRMLCEQFFCCRDEGEMLRLVLCQYHEVMGLMAGRRHGETDFVIARIKSILAERFAQGVTVAEVAQAVYLTPTYVCQLFKKETGMTVNDYLTDLRMEKAKELLRDVSFKQYDVCYAVGYASPSYFTRLFKKYTGLTPNEYRDQVIA